MSDAPVALIPQISGAGGVFGKGSKGGKESPDSLASNSTAKILDLICEGEIQGLVNGANSIYLNKTPVENLDGTSNFKEGFAYDFRPGTPLQDPIKGIGDTVESETAVGVEVTKSNGPITRTIISSNLDAVKVLISFAKLAKVDSKGNIKGTKVSYRILVKTGEGQFLERVRDTVDGKASSTYQRQYYIPLTQPGPWDVRVERLTDDSTSEKVVDKFEWTAYTEVVEVTLRYPNSALVGLRFDAEQFNSVPERAYDIKGLIIRIPSNATVRADGSLTYSGIWDGTFKLAWSSNPAWCLYDLLINSRYGCGINPTQINRFAFYQIGYYCDELVPDGYGGTEPRFSCNVYIQSREDAYKVINDFCSVFRGMAYWAEGSITVTQDSPATAVRAFNQANVVDGKFTYSGSAQRARHTIALVAWNDPEDFYRRNIEVVEDTEGIRLYGAREADITAFACTSRGQAHRVGKWLLYSEINETDTVSFGIGSEGIPIRPGEIAQIGDPKRAGVRNFGRVKSATTTSVTLDAPVTLDSGQTYTLTVILPNGSREERTVTTAPGSNLSSLTVGSAYSQAPQKAAVWLLTSTSQPPKLYRVLGVTERDQSNQYEVTGLIYNPLKYAAVEQGFVFEAKPKPRLPTASVNVPRNVQTQIYASLQSTGRAINLSVFWDYPLQDGKRDEFVPSYDVEYRQGTDGVWQGTTRTSSRTFDWYNLPEGEYYARVRSVDIVQQTSAWVESATPVSAGVAPTITSISPSEGVVGDSITITGTGFTGASEVSFGGVEAVYTVVSDTQITTTVPQGASSGEIIVVTPGGAASF